MPFPHSRSAFGLTLALALALLLPASSAWAQDASESLIILVRHAERAEDGTDDPHLSEAGRERAAHLARMLRDVGVTHVHSTDRNRTRETAAPVLAATGLELQIYSTGDTEGFVRRLRDTPGRHLVVGHSNTVPALARELGGEAGPDIGSLEYDRLYLLTVGPAGTTTVLLRFGAPFER